MHCLLGIFLLSTFLAAGTCLQCEVCSGPGTSCTGQMKTCGSNEDTCVVLLTEYFQSPLSLKLIAKDCGTSEICKVGTPQVNFGNGVKMRTNVFCCSGDGCEKDFQAVSPLPYAKPNGNHCPGCIGLYSTDCHEEAVACLGSETKCINLAMNLTKSANDQIMDVTLKGCANDAACAKIKWESKTFSGWTSKTTRAECNDASSISSNTP